MEGSVDTDTKTGDWRQGGGGDNSSESGKSGNLSHTDEMQADVIEEPQTSEPLNNSHLMSTPKKTPANHELSSKTSKSLLQNYDMPPETTENFLENHEVQTNDAGKHSESHEISHGTVKVRSEHLQKSLYAEEKHSENSEISRNIVSEQSDNPEQSSSVSEQQSEKHEISNQCPEKLSDSDLPYLGVSPKSDAKTGEFENRSMIDDSGIFVNKSVSETNSGPEDGDNDDFKSCPEDGGDALAEGSTVDKKVGDTASIIDKLNVVKSSEAEGSTVDKNVDDTASRINKLNVVKSSDDTDEGHDDSLDIGDSFDLARTGLSSNSSSSSGTESDEEVVTTASQTRRTNRSHSSGSDMDIVGENENKSDDVSSGSDMDVEFENLVDRWNPVLEVYKREVGLSNRFPSNFMFSMKVGSSIELARRLHLEAKLKKHEGCVNSLNFNGAGNLLASGSDDLRVILWKWMVGKPYLMYESGHRSNVFQCKFMPYSGDCHIISCARDGQIRLAELSSTGICKNTKKLAQHRGAAHKLALQHDSPHVFYSCGEDAVTFEVDLRMDKPTKLFTTKKKKVPTATLR